jgi:hypothetical protein
MINRKLSAPSHHPTTKPEPRPSIYTQFRTIDVIHEIWSIEPAALTSTAEYYRVKGREARGRRQRIRSVRG